MYNKTFRMLKNVETKSGKYLEKDEVYEKNIFTSYLNINEGI